MLLDKVHLHSERGDRGEPIEAPHLKRDAAVRVRVRVGVRVRVRGRPRVRVRVRLRLRARVRVRVSDLQREAAAAEVPRVAQECVV